MLKESQSILDEDKDEAKSMVVVDKKFKLLFGSDSIYLFLRLYGFLIALMHDIKEYLNMNPTTDDRRQSYYNPLKYAEGDKPEVKLDFASMTAKLGEVVVKNTSLKDFET